MSDIVRQDGKIKISINVPGKLLYELDLNREEAKQDRSSWVASAIMEKLASIKREEEKQNQQRAEP